FDLANRPFDDGRAGIVQLARIVRTAEPCNATVRILRLEIGAGTAADLCDAREVVYLGVVDGVCGEIGSGMEHQLGAIKAQAVVTVVGDRAHTLVRLITRGTAPNTRKPADIPTPTGDAVARAAAVDQREFRRHAGHAGRQVQLEPVNGITL